MNAQLNLILKKTIENILRRIATQKYKTNKETGEKEFSGWEANDYNLIMCQWLEIFIKKNLPNFFGVEKFEYLNFLIDSFYFNTDTAKWTWKERQYKLWMLILEELRNSPKFVNKIFQKGKSTTEILKLLNAEKKAISDNKEKNC